MSQIREYNITIPNTAGAFNVDLSILHGITVYDTWFIKTGGAGGAADTVTLSNQSGSAVSNAMDCNVADATVVRAGTISDATYMVTAAQGLRATCNNGNAGVFGGVLTCIGVPTLTP
tara:strand:- start:365 stop:715 length:351 start_codon:yes stop_codon:yes gene_type:complete